jgi:tetratricopeptide (TPR) repeat protein
VAATSQTPRERAITLHREGRLAEAEGIYSQLLRQDPCDADVLHLQGVLAHQTGRYDRAVELIRRAITLHRTAAACVSLGTALMALGRPAEALASYEGALALQPDSAAAFSASAAALRELGRPQEALARADAAIVLQPTTEAHCHRGAALRDLGRYAEAVASFDQAIALAPQCVEAHAYRGLALQQLQRTTEALESFDRALILRPQWAELHSNRGDALRHLERFAEALASYERAIALQPALAAAHNNRGLALQGLGRWHEAVAAYQRALTVQPEFAEAHNNLATVQYELGQPAAALESLKRALELQPAMPGAHGNLGNALRDLERPEEALTEYERALRDAPDRAASHCHCGNALFDLARIPEAIASYDRALELDPQHAHSHFNKSLCLLLSGDFTHGLPLYEWRKALSEAVAPAPPGRGWLGEEDIAGRTLFVYADQALGDTIQFCRYARLAEERGARVVLAVQPQLRELLTTLSPTLRIIASGEPSGGYDCHCALMSLPLAFRTTLADIPAAVPYLSADPLRIARWRTRLGETGFRVGIAWRGSRNRIDVGRSVPPDTFAALAAVPGVRLISLQKGEALAQLLQAAPSLPVEGLGEDFDAGAQAFLDSAAVMAHLDLVITCDTALAHLAGALGRPTWVALKHVPDWRWLQGRADSPWYPSMRLFRQPRRGDWQSVFAAIHGELGRLAQARRQDPSR